MNRMLIILIAVVSFAFSCNSSKKSTEIEVAPIQAKKPIITANNTTTNYNSTNNNTTNSEVELRKEEEMNERIEKVKNTTNTNTNTTNTNTNTNTTESSATNTTQENNNALTNIDIIGEYVWVKTICCGRLRNVTTPESKDEVVKLEFKTNGKMVKTTNNARAAEINYNYMQNGKIYPNRPQLHIDGKNQDALIRMEDGMLVLDYQYMDLQLEYYKKIK